MCSSPVTETFLLNELLGGECGVSIGNQLQEHGYLRLLCCHCLHDIGGSEPRKVNCDDHAKGSDNEADMKAYEKGSGNSEEFGLSEDERWCLSHWEVVFRRVFECDEEVKASWPSFSSVNGYTVGYRKDGKREFLESRLSGTSCRGVEPEVASRDDREIYGLDRMIKICFRLYRRIGVLLLGCIAETLGVEDKYFLDLIDEAPAWENGPPSGPIIKDRLSSSLLRICNYPPNDDISTVGKSAFGAHTDVSLLTLAPRASCPGLEIRDLKTHEWVQIENMESNCPVINVFVGDIMQMLTRSIFKATVHRVMSSEAEVNDQKEKSQIVPRVSCPFIMRGRHITKIAPLAAYARYPSSLLKSSDDDDDDGVCGRSDSHPDYPELPDLEGSSMKLLHKLLDLKRQKCLRNNSQQGMSESSEDWVLSAYENET